MRCSRIYILKHFAVLMMNKTCYYFFHLFNLPSLTSNARWSPTPTIKNSLSQARAVRPGESAAVAVGRGHGASWYVHCRCDTRASCCAKGSSVSEEREKSLLNVVVASVYRAKKKLFAPLRVLLQQCSDVSTLSAHHGRSSTPSTKEPGKPRRTSA